MPLGTATDRHLQRVYCWFANGDSSERLAKGNTGRSEAYMWSMNLIFSYKHFISSVWESVGHSFAVETSVDIHCGCRLYICH